jgi:hypothetical protein
MNGSGKIVQLVNPTNNQDAATKRYVDTSIPVGGIIMWSGSNSSLPSNWKFCDGANGTPDLRGRFVMCMNRQLNGDSNSSGPLNYWADINTTGGSPDAVVVTHNHEITDPGHQHKLIEGMGIVYGSPASWFARDGGSGAPNPRTDIKTTGITINNKGESGTNKNIPQHYVLAYIMRVW